jgi:hypothetical protein
VPGPTVIERRDYVVRVIRPWDPSGLIRVWVKAGLAHHHGDAQVLVVPLEAEAPDEEASTDAAAAVGFQLAVCLPPVRRARDGRAPPRTVTPLAGGAYRQEANTVG